MNLKKSLLLALIVGIAAITSWELYWRSQGYEPGLEDTKELWAVQRSRMDKAGDKDVVLLGDSRMLFDLKDESRSDRKFPLCSYHDHKPHNLIETM